MTEMKTLLSGNHDIMTSLNKKKVSGDYIGAIPFLAAFDILATFKDGHDFKEGQHTNCLPKMRFFCSLLDYTCDYNSRCIWGEGTYNARTMAILWLRRDPIFLNKSCMSLIIKYLQNSRFPEGELYIDQENQRTQRQGRNTK